MYFLPTAVNTELKVKVCTVFTGIYGWLTNKRGNKKVEYLDVHNSSHWPWEEAVTTKQEKKKKSFISVYKKKNKRFGAPTSNKVATELQFIWGNPRRFM